MSTVTVTANSPIEEVAKTQALQVVNDNCNAQQLEAIKKLASNAKLREILNLKTIDKLEKNLIMVKSFL